MKRKFFLVASVTIFILILGWIFRVDRFGFQSIKWEDILIINGSHYIGQYNKDEHIIVQKDLIGQKIGNVKFTLSENVRNQHYVKRNFDASFLKKGTEIYEIKDNKNRSKITAKVGDEFYLYLLE